MTELRLQFTAPEPARTTSRDVPLGRVLVNAGLIDQAHLVRALEEQARLDVPLGEVLVARGVVNRDDVNRAVAIQHHLQLVDLALDPPQGLVAAQIDAWTCLAHGIVPWRSLGGTILVATSRPDLFAAINRQRQNGSEWLPVLADASQINQAITRLYGAELAHRAVTRVPARESCRSWQIDRGKRQAWAISLLLLLLALVLMSPTWTMLILWALCNNVLTVSLRSLAFLADVFLGNDPPQQAPPKRAPSHRPTVSVLVPLLHEKDIATALIARLMRLTYPKALLQIVLVLEEGDHLTRATIARTSLPPWFTVIEVPKANRLQTKPRALNYALDFCRGSIIGVWNAEDAPVPDQIDRVVEHFATAPDHVACVQGRLDYYNARTNWLSRCFTIEYAAWWRVILPGIARLGLIIPLGGTTLFFRRDHLEILCGWDAHNVTEDADLGVRLARHGYRTDLLPTVTFEEANCRSWPWVKQRSRWLKGFLTTWCVHMRHPIQLLRQVGLARFLGIQTLFLATFSQFICAPLLWSFCMTLFGATHPVEATLGTPVLVGLFWFFVVAEFVNMAIALRAVAQREHRHLVPYIITLPVYFLLGTLAAYKALYEFVVSPFYWDKTEHGVALPTSMTSAPKKG